MAVKKKKQFAYDFGIDHYKGLLGIYFNKIIRNIIDIGKLNERTGLRVLDFGCGLKKLKPLIKNYIGYDIDEKFTEIKDWRKAEFDVVVANQVFKYMAKEELEAFIKQLYRRNPKVEMIFGATKINTKIFKFLKKSYVDVKLSYDEQLAILNKYFTMLNKKTLLGLNDIYLMKFK